MGETRCATMHPMNHLNHLLLIAIFGGLAGNTVIASQEFANERIEAIFERFDSNQDDIITEEEAGGFWQRLARADLNKDGEVSKEELYEAWGEEPPRPEPGPGPKPKN